eukprot:TRINITY_DN4284_c5_g1_i1.p2 TRINITY_DN4284_c5_g1~~TRINITY_DN4284_c5_g1_i1.p2  ORF type:complete len:451 (+),score=42.32 TRINITY_DN4284_c5_g1_i1:1633-2985(+)
MENNSPELVREARTGSYGSSHRRMEKLRIYGSSAPTSYKPQTTSMRLRNRGPRNTNLNATQAKSGVFKVGGPASGKTLDSYINALPNQDTSYDGNIYYDTPKSATLPLNRKKLFGKANKTVIKEFSPDNAKEIEELRTTLQSVTIENEKLRRLSKEIMLDHHQKREMASTVHSFYQNVVLADTEQNVTLLKSTIDDLKSKIAELITKNLQLQEENKKLKVTALRYRELAMSQIPNKSQKPLEEASPDRLFNYLAKRESTDKSPEMSRFRPTANASEDSGSVVGNSIAAGIKASKENVHLEMIYTSLKRISKTGSLKALIEALYRELAILLKVHKVGVFIIDPNLRKLYQKEQGIVQTMYVGKTNIDLALNSSVNYFIKPAFGSCAAAKNSIRNNEAIVISVTGSRAKLGSELYLAVQLENKHTHIESRGNYENELWVTLKLAQYFPIDKK